MSAVVAAVRVALVDTDAMPPIRSTARRLLDLQDGQLAVSGRGGLERVIVGCDYADGK